MNIENEQLGLKLLVGEYTVHKLAPNSDIPNGLARSEFYSITRTKDELSIVCRSNLDVCSKKNEAQWRCIEVLGVLAFELTGILAKLSATLAAADISLFAISTFNTDYLLVKANNIEKAKQCLQEAGYNTDEMNLERAAE